MKKAFKIIILTILFSLNHVYAQVEGRYHSVGYFNHPTSPRSFLLDKVLNKTNDSIFHTTIGDLTVSYGTLVLNIHKNNTVTYESSYTPFGGINYSIIPTKDSINNYDPILKKFNLHYEYILPSGKRSIREVLTIIPLISKTINLTSPGTLSTSLTATELSYINDLTITGVIDARDFKTMRDKMPYLAYIDIGNVNINAYTGTEGPDYINNTTVYLENGIPQQAFRHMVKLVSIIMPKTIISIGTEAFYYCNSLKGSLNIPSTVSSIGYNAFQNCSKLTGELIIPSSLTSIPQGVFSGCRGFTGSLAIPPLVKIIGNSAFAGCIGFTGTLHIPSTVTSIGRNAFDGCSGFTDTLIIPSSINSIGINTFRNCTGLTGTLSIPSSISRIEDGAFSGCTGLNGLLIFPSSINSIGGSAFSGCTGFTGMLSIPSTIKSVGAAAFDGCTGFTSLSISSAIKSIEDYTFRNCNGLTGKLIIPSSVTTIGYSAFEGCNKITGSLIIPPSVKSIGYKSFFGCSSLSGILTIPTTVTTIISEAFGGCSGLNSIYAYGSNPGNISLGGFVFLGISTDSCKLYVPLGKKSLYAAADQWKDFKNIIDGVPASVTTQAVTSINTVTPIGNGTITDLDLNNPTNYGIVWSKAANPTISLTTKTIHGIATATGTFSSAMNGLTPNTLYYVKAYTTNSAGTSYGEEVSFTTPISVLNSPSTSILSGFRTSPGLASSSQTFLIEGSSLVANLIVTAPTGFEIREKNIGIFSSSVSISPVSGVISKTIEVRIAASNIMGNVAGNIVCSSAWATNQTVEVSGEITLKQLTITPPTVTINKMVDGNSNAIVTGIGSLSGFNAADVNNVSVNATATYDNASVGTNKTITVVYTLTGSAKDKYQAPANYVITNAKISDYITLSPLSTPAPGCEGSSMVLPFNLLTGTPTQYKITFNSAALNAGMKNIVYRDLSNANAGGTLTFSVPNNTLDGTYQGIVKMRNELYVESIDYPFTFTINVSADNILTKFDDVVLFNNFSNRFTGFQWYKNGVEIAGATKQFYVDPTGLVGSYSVKLTTTDNQTLYSCPSVLNIPSSKVKVKIGTTPNPVRIQSSCSIQIEGLNNDQLKDGKLSVYNMQGICVYESTAIEKVNKLNLPVTGVYIGHLTAQGNDYMFKIIVVQ